ncbi:MAG: hypothetical protein PUF72_11920 [Clostridiales bacterium]|nr:hypothetical protein [Clostridiales bacterium]
MSDFIIGDGIKNPPSKYRPVPFWSWNEKLETEETVRQIRLMHEAGMGGFFMHARGGLQTEYMGEEWFDNVKACADESKVLDMHPWAYDENGWPSGFGSGKVNGLGIDYIQKYLRYAPISPEKEKEVGDRIIHISDKHIFYYDTNPFYVDVLDKKVIKAFIDEIYEPYYKRFKNDIDGFFTDEPQVSRDGIPWSFVLRDAYKEEYGEELYDRLEDLFFESESSADTRVKFWRLVAILFSQAYSKQIYDWCDERGLKFTGHMVLEESLESQITANGAIMPQYEYYHVPGMDWLGRNIYDCLTPIQLGSAAAQLGKNQVLSETFAMCGHNVSFDELLGIYQWQMVRGINLLCQHLEGYSLRGIRKRDYPPAMGYQQPWWGDYKIFNDFVSRVGMLLCEGKIECDTLVIHPQAKAWSCFDCGENKGVEECNELLLKTIGQLDKKHILFHLGDEILMERHSCVRDGQLVIGKQKYSKVIVITDVMLDNTKRLIEEFKAQGGIVTTAEELPQNDITDNESITYTKRIFDDFVMYYFVNSTDKKQKARVKYGNQIMDIYGKLSDFDGELELEPWGSAVIIDNGNERVKKEKTRPQKITPQGAWKIEKCTDNVLTIDSCSCRFNGESIGDNLYMIDIQNRACSISGGVRVECEFSVKADYIPDKLYFVCETPEKFTIKINGEEIEKNVCGYFADSSFKKIEISRYMKIGENKFLMETDFKQPAELYENLKKAQVFESEKNKLSFDTEIEPVYITGQFALETEGEFKKLDKNAVRYTGDFVIDKLPESVSISNLEQQGFPFFAGSITLSCDIDQEGLVSFEKKGVNVVKFGGGSEEKTCITAPIEYMTKNNRLTVTLTNNLRNMLGPHHLAEGESYSVFPGSFYKEPCIWAPEPLEWDDNWCFVEFGLF